MEKIRNTPPGYETKFANFIKGCKEAKTKNAEHMVVAQPWVIGDTYEEVMESLSLLAEAKLALYVAEPLNKA